nr:hypothetical protein [uncultured Romboutsia sp.]
MKKENTIILCGIAVTVLISAGFTISQGTISSADDDYVTPKHVMEELKEDLELEENADEIDEENDYKDNDDSDEEERSTTKKTSTSKKNSSTTKKTNNIKDEEE